MEIRYSKAAARALARCDKRRLIREKLELLARDPAALAANVKRLAGRDDYRLGVQDWRILFRNNGEYLDIDEISQRGTAYEDRS